MLEIIVLVQFSYKHNRTSPLSYIARRSANYMAFQRVCYKRPGFKGILSVFITYGNTGKCLISISFYKITVGNQNV